MKKLEVFVIVSRRGCVDRTRVLCSELGRVVAVNIPSFIKMVSWHINIVKAEAP